MYAVVQTGGKQYRVENEQKLLVDKLKAEEGSIVTLNDLIMVVDNGKISLGKSLDNIAVSATVLKQTRGSKIITLKHKRRKNSRKVIGHKQDLTLLKVVGIGDPKKLVIKEAKSVSKPSKVSEKDAKALSKDQTSKAEDKKDIKKVTNNESKKKSSPAIKDNQKQTKVKPNKTSKK